MRFTEDGVYETGFSEPIRPSRDRRHAAAFPRYRSRYLWEFFDPASDGGTGYARLRFSYASRLPESMGRPVLFEGIGCFRFRGELVARYSEEFDRGNAPGPARLSGRAYQVHPGKDRGGAKPSASGP